MEVKHDGYTITYFARIHSQASIVDMDKQCIFIRETRSGDVTYHSWTLRAAAYSDIVKHKLRGFGYVIQSPPFEKNSEVLGITYLWK